MLIDRLLDTGAARALVAGRKSIDTDALEDAGIDIEPFYRTGRESERLTIKVNR